MAAKGFDASKYLTDVNGRDYLEVKWRLLWLRTEHPDAVVETELVKHGAGLAVFRARVAIPGAGQASGWGSETADDFEEYIEKAETKALGRALAALGYGTQFCEDFDFSAESPAKPVGQRQSRGRRNSAAPSRRAAHRNGASGEPEPKVVDTPVASGGLRVVRDRPAAASSGATPPQVKAIYSIARDHHALDDQEVETRCRERYGRPPAELSKRQASEFIDLLRGARTSSGRPTPAASV